MKRAAHWTAVQGGRKHGGGEISQRVSRLAVSMNSATCVGRLSRNLHWRHL